MTIFVWTLSENPIDTIAGMEKQQKAGQILELVRQRLAGMSLVHLADEGLTAFETEHGGVRHRVCYPDELLARCEARDLASVAVSILTMLRADPVPTRVVVRSGMLETMLRTAASQPSFPAATQS